ncbi:hypothetical protein [Sphingopyxis sp. 113P3]|uniref:hypothetical protein n=1 Tax=Sphingopyxis sp. (strain 113P3) TaxID=292913 RepID=UPI0006AD1AB7|nr:hypothetical protein [Sphingopyxis sp. 113P3]ALC12516.1 hypothetical protein LH20_11190 [Sphingopyxis sp. 113P3]
MTRSARPYAAGAENAQRFDGIDVEEPVAGFYRIRLGAETVAVGIRLWFGAPLDPLTGEELDRGWRWQAQADDGSILDFERVWPACARDPITEADFNARRARRAWARENAPDSAYAELGRKVDRLSRSEPLPF